MYISAEVGQYYKPQHHNNGTLSLVFYYPIPLLRRGRNV